MPYCLLTLLVYMALEITSRNFLARAQTNTIPLLQKSENQVQYNLDNLFRHGSLHIALFLGKSLAVLIGDNPRYSTKNHWIQESIKRLFTSGSCFGQLGLQRKKNLFKIYLHWFLAKIKYIHKHAGVLYVIFYFCWKTAHQANKF